MVARGMAGHLHLQVLEAADGREAVLLFEKRHEEIHLVLMDLTMPYMDGREAAECMHAVNPEVPVILSSGFDELEAYDRLRGDNVVGFLPKPYQVHQFQEVLLKALDRG
jgi:CheY-like chemotaxis protein